MSRRPTLGRAPSRRIVPGHNSIARAGSNLQRGRTLIRPDRYQEPAPLLTGKQESSSAFDPWVIISRIFTFWAIPPMLKAMGKSDKGMQQAWREKVTLCMIIAMMGGLVAFLTVGLSMVLCPPDQSNNQELYAHYNDTVTAGGLVGIQGWQFNISQSKPTATANFYALAAVPGTDITYLFQNHGQNIAACTNPGNANTAKFTAITFDPCSTNTCVLDPISAATFAKYGLVNTTRQVGFDWTQLANSNLTNYFVIDGNVLNMDPYMKAHPTPIANDALDGVIRSVLNTTFAEGGKDATKAFFRNDELKAASDCLVQKYYAGHIDKSTPGCFAASLILYFSLLIILSLVLSRFFMAMIFAWFYSRKLSKTPPPLKSSASSVNLLPKNTMEMGNASNWSNRGDSPAFTKPVEIGNDLFTVMLITCYSEGLESIKGTVESLATTDYPDDRKLLFVIADGIITGSGETVSTPDVCLSLMHFDNPADREAQPMPYVAVAAGAKQFNCAKVYAGHYATKKHKVPMILIVKCGNPDEQGKPKPGNRGKRDSQLILMNFFSRVTYNDRMTPLDYDMFRKIQRLMNVTPDYFECCLMVDADTKVYKSSMRLLINCMINDNLIMGLCGETKIANKRDSWVTAIQVYEYYISHHLAKGFESIFGGVTCLPGCFCMYRLKARKGDGDWVPIITKPEIVQEYSQNTVTTLHQKNLLLLGEDRFLTTLMLRNFPHRKMVFTPQAICKTVVPDEFKVLLSQRRRWINSTIHNLFELVLVRNLCGTFCFSMQFVVMMDLIGTLVLPVAIILTVVLIISMARTQITSFVLAVPLMLLIIVLFSPAILILITTRKWIYIAWMGVYLLALPIWNFVLPVYSFWHFDDFSWGETRKVTGEGKGDDHGKKDGVFDPSKVPMKRWEEHERARIRAFKRQERKRRNQQNQPPLPSGFAHSVMPGDDESHSRLLDNASDMSMDTPDNLGSPVNYFDPSKEGAGKAGGYYPSYRPTDNQNLPLPAASAAGPWGPTSYSNPMASPRSPQSMSRPMPPPPSPGGPPIQHQRPLQLQQGFVPQGSPQMRPPGPGGYRPPPPRNGSNRPF
ncbi:chitin synthase-domain-containing protein [Umbelopsis sp. PMI_123]|nr:chitin synthase-domain-containing protein [Umbelopsis sp. PMI_123]